jgi:hypothetical protein
MSRRLADAIQSGAYARGSQAPLLNLAHGGQHGWAPNLAELTSNQAYVSRPVICMLLQAPQIFRAFPDGPKWVQAIKAMFELHARTIEGMNATLTVETDEHPVGGAGEVQQEIVNSRRERTAPRFGFTEKYGRPIQTLLETWIRYGGMDPNTKFALASVLQGGNFTDLLMDQLTATCIFIVPDPLHRNVDKAWITTNMFPLGTSDITARRDLTASQEILQLDIEFTGTSQYGYGVNVFAQRLLDSIRTRHADPFYLPALTDRVDADVEAAEKGYKPWLEEVGRTSTGNMDA